MAADPFTMGAAIVGGLFGAAGQNTANAVNLDEAERTRKWQEAMSNTAYQRQMADMKAAGLNPMLSIMKGGGASSGGGAQAGNAGNPGEAINSALKYAAGENRKLQAEIDLLEEQKQTTRAQGNAAIQQSAKTQEEAIGQAISNTVERGTMQTQIEAGNISPWVQMGAKTIQGVGGAAHMISGKGKQGLPTLLPGKGGSAKTMNQHIRDFSKQQSNFKRERGK